ncbi:3-phosphoshikimate 1-carboxyvinyltransferase [Flavobacterium selenitireducens]|uniref:3-phosphoshikimate 1-carboxyvinyltransferase n=1 Tax=Flavobacterium selenitireducens TaxID=2722704 RepID=UPI00168B0940|nr:3-phosphoshikimate 1-carboxyvinyltransferase [Flavobacterium selenitireducens]MBD3583214.1 3-phosphoshikimate 1-carboxyvinyltransferase [Flavobacterium selenitireducens]
MKIAIEKSQIAIESRLFITGSKSETNRLLLLQALYPEIAIENASESDDSHAMRNALSATSEVIDIHHAGTAMRFLTAYFSIQENRTVTLTGSQRMQERPIRILVEALRQLGAQIDYVKNEGFPPLKIVGKKLNANKVTLDAGVSSQYISALLLIAPKLGNGLEIRLEGVVTSVPYLKMTLALLKELGVECAFADNRIAVKPANEIKKTKLVVESDWSSASYFYSIVALSHIGTRIELSSFKADSLQGDSALDRIYQDFGVVTSYSANSIVLRKAAECRFSEVNYDLSPTPDIAQTIAVTCFGLGIGCRLEGLHTLKIKETDRLEALKTELSKFGAKTEVTHDSLSLAASQTIVPNVTVDTYNDHRMAMAFAPLGLRTSVAINDAEVVTKSFPTFWSDLQKLGFTLERYI